MNLLPSKEEQKKETDKECIGHFHRFSNNRREHCLEQLDRHLVSPLSSPRQLRKKKQRSVLLTCLCSTLPPATVKTGYATALLTLPPVTKTAFTINTAYSWQTKTMTATFVKMTTVTPTGVMTACKSMGGHFGNGW